MGLITLVVLFVISLFALGIAIARFQTRKGFSYLELFLPRLVGAGFVGLSILALESTVWDVSAKLPTFSWLFVVLAAYTGSLAYIFLNVHKTTRLLPVMDPLESQRKPKRRNHPQVSYIMTRSVKTAGRIFAIGALEAMGLTIFIASFLPLDQVFDGIPLTILNWHGLLLQIWSPHGVIIQWDHFLRLTYFPKIIILWAGLALLIGAFVQLLWQDRQITAS
jgi:hypothetical protein